MTKYKITDKGIKTHNGCQWEIGVKKTITKKGISLCSDEVFHYYDSPGLAVILNTIHGSYDPETMRLWEINCDSVAHDGLKGGSKWQILQNEIPIPAITTTQKVAFGIYCALNIYKDKAFVAWANNWLKGKDRAAKWAEAVAATKWAPTSPAEWEAERAAKWATESAAKWATASQAEWWAASAAEWAASAAKWAIAAEAVADIFKLALEKALKVKEVDYD